MKDIEKLLKHGEKVTASLCAFYTYTVDFWEATILMFDDYIKIESPHSAISFPKKEIISIFEPYEDSVSIMFRDRSDILITKWETE